MCVCTAYKVQVNIQFEMIRYDSIEFLCRSNFLWSPCWWTRTAKFKCTKTVLLLFGQMSLVCNGRNVTREIFVIIQCAFVLTTWHIFPTFFGNLLLTIPRMVPLHELIRHSMWIRHTCLDTFFVYAIHRPYIRYTHIKLLFIPMQIISIKIITSKTFAGKCFAILMESKWCVENSVFIVCVEYWIRYSFDRIL